MTRDAFVRYVKATEARGHPWHWLSQQLTAYKKGRSYYLTYGPSGPRLNVYSSDPRSPGKVLDQRDGLEAVQEWERVTGLEVLDELGLEVLL